MKNKQRQIFVCAPSSLHLQYGQTAWLTDWLDSSEKVRTKHQVMIFNRNNPVPSLLHQEGSREYCIGLPYVRVEALRGSPSFPLSPKCQKIYANTYSPNLSLENLHSHCKLILHQHPKVMPNYIINILNLFLTTVLNIQNMFILHLLSFGGYKFITTI